MRTVNNVLVVSDTIPSYDTNAGDWRIYTICRELARKRTVYFLPLAFLWEGHKYSDDLRKAGVTIIAPGFRDIYDFPALIRALGLTTVIFEWYDTAEHFLKYFPICERVIIDSHELYYLKEMRRSKVERGISRAYVKALREKELSIYRMADAVIAISEDEKAVLTKEMPHKTVMVLPTWGNMPTEAAKREFKDRKDIVFFASFLNREQIDAVIYFMKYIWPSVAAAVPGLRFHIAGEHSHLLANMLAKREREQIVIDGRIEDIGEYLSRFRIFVCPLRYGAGLKKKILDAVLAGCPIVTTHGGIEGYAMRPGKDVLVASTPAEFAGKTADLYNDEKTWDILSKNAGNRIREYHPYGQGLQLLERYLDGNRVPVSRRK